MQSFESPGHTIPSAQIGELKTNIIDEMRVHRISGYRESLDSCLAYRHSTHARRTMGLRVRPAPVITAVQSQDSACRPAQRLGTRIATASRSALVLGAPWS